MCGILISTKEISDPISALLVNRGPDYTNIKKDNGINFVHTLLSMTGKFTMFTFCLTEKFTITIKTKTMILIFFI